MKHLKRICASSAQQADNSGRYYFVTVLLIMKLGYEDQFHVLILD